MKHHHVLLACCGAVIAAGGVCRADEVTHWSEVVQQAIRVNGGPPCPIGRAVAMTHTVMYDAVNSIERTHRPYLAFVAASPDASKEAAVAQACHDVLVDVYPAQTSTFDAELAARLALIPDGTSKTAGIAVGAAAATQCIASRVGDGSDQPVTYVFGSSPGDYRTPEDDPPTPPFNPEWGNTRPFAMTGPHEFRLRGPLGFSNMNALMHSRAYADQLNEVKSVGYRNSTTRTDDQTQLAFFWANDVNGTYKPPGQLMHIAEEISATAGLTLSENARLFGLLGLAMGDAGIVSWDMKYNTATDLWRPITGIRNADIDGNPHTTKDPNWLPLNSFTPPFPSWTSGHSTFGGATAAVLEEFFGTDHMTFTISSEDPFYNALPTHPNRTFHTFTSMGLEDALSRVYLGVHWRTDCEDGFRTGQELGHMIGHEFMRPVCDADFNGDGQVNAQDLLAFLHAFFAGSSAADFNHDGHINNRDLHDFMNAFFSGCGG